MSTERITGTEEVGEMDKNLRSLRIQQDLATTVIRHWVLCLILDLQEKQLAFSVDKQPSEIPILMGEVPSPQ